MLLWNFFAVSLASIARVTPWFSGHAGQVVEHVRLLRTFFPK
jgi:hypothetical protein